MPGYQSGIPAQNSQRASAQVLDVSYDTSTDGCKVVFKGILGNVRAGTKVILECSPTGECDLNQISVCCYKLVEFIWFN